MGSKTPAAVGERISKGERYRFGAAAPFSTKTVIPARESGRFGFHAESGRDFRTVLDPFCRKAIPMHRLNCFSGALRALASLLVCWHVCLHGKTWLPSVFFFFFFFNLTSRRWTSSLPSCLWSLRIFPSLPGSRLTIFYRDGSSALLQLVNQRLNFSRLAKR